VLDPDIGPDRARLVDSIVAWADERRVALATGEPAPLRVWAIDDGPAEDLRRLGFEREERPGFVHFTGELADLDQAWPPPSLPPGWRLRPLDDEADLVERVACGRAAFVHSTMTVERYRTVFEAWLYRPDLDLQIETADGRTAAFALGWLDPATATVGLEPVGVHPNWHRRGLGGEMCRATMRAARNLGARRTMIAADRANAGALALYASLGLTITTDIVPFARPTAVLEDR
jgi:GNAT superfamily N-acetyltransferase